MRREQLDSSLKVVKFLIRRQITLHITKNPNSVRMKNIVITVVVQIRKDLGGFFNEKQAHFKHFNLTISLSINSFDCFQRGIFFILFRLKVSRRRAPN
jgi:hypothetical protein